MTLVDSAAAREFLEAVIAAFSILGGGMAYLSGYYAAQAMTRQKAPEIVARRINEGIGRGFKWLSPISVVALIIMAWT